MRKKENFVLNLVRSSLYDLTLQFAMPEHFSLKNPPRVSLTTKILNLFKTAKLFFDLRRQNGREEQRRRRDGLASAANDLEVMESRLGT